MKTTEQINEESMESVKQSILNGEIYAKINKVSASGMTRYISFYRSQKDTTQIQNVTGEVAWLANYTTVGSYKQWAKYIIDDGLKVQGCGMDMIFHVLYSTLPYEQAKEWNQRYNTL